MRRLAVSEISQAVAYKDCWVETARLADQFVEQAVEDCLNRLAANLGVRHAIEGMAVVPIILGDKVFMQVTVIGRQDDAWHVPHSEDIG